MNENTTLMNWDELNILRVTAVETLQEQRKQKDEKKLEEFCDYMEFVLCLIYAYGWHDAEQIVGIVPFKDGLDDKCVNLEIREETFRDRVREQMNAGSIEGILRIIDTEAHRDYNTGVYDCGVKSGQPGIRKRWWTMADGRVRDEHSYLHGVKVGLGDRFYTYTGDSTLYPGGFGVPELDCGCRCWITLVK